MEFHEKLQLLRKQNDLTQEQLAERLFVSRTAISKWESGRGYPNLESLKSLSGLFSVSIDQLLSNDELVQLAETENRTHLHQLSAMVFGGVDMMVLSALFMPFFAEPEGEYIRAVGLLFQQQVGGVLRLLYFGTLMVMVAMGVLEVVVGVKEHERGLRWYQPCSILLSSAAVLLFALSRQPYMTAFLFLLFLLKVMLILRGNRGTYRKI